MGLSRRKKPQPVVLDEMETRRAEEYLCAKDPVLREVILGHGSCDIYLQGVNFFEKIVDSIISQQLSAQAARTIKGRVRHYAGAIDPESFVRSDPDKLRECGLSKAKVRYITGISRSIVNGMLDLNALRDMESEEVVNVLTALPGIGKWTAEMFLIFALRHADVLSCSDAGLQRAVRKLYGEKKLLLNVGKKWSPYRSVASWHLWRYLDSNTLAD